MKRILLTIATFAIMCAGCSKQEALIPSVVPVEDGRVRTAYRDLPAADVQRLKVLLDAEDLSLLDDESCTLLFEHMRSAVLTARTPFGLSVTSNYFWNIYLQLPEFVDSRERHHGYYREEKKAVADQRLMAYACYRLDRSPENLRRMFAKIKPILLNSVSADMYRQSRAADYVSGLVNSYRELESIPGSRKGLAAFYKSVYTSNGAVRADAPAEVLERYNNTAYGLSVYDLSELIAAELKISRHSGLYGTPFLPFWMRRVKEGNIDEVYAILCEIEKMYAQQ